LLYGIILIALVSCLIIGLVLNYIIGARLYWCWIVDDYLNYEFYFEYAWVLVIFIFNLVFYVAIMKKKCTETKSCICGCNVVWYLLVYIFVYTPALLFRILRFFKSSNDAVFYLGNLYYIFISFKGLLNFFVTFFVYVFIEGNIK